MQIASLETRKVHALLIPDNKGNLQKNVNIRNNNKDRVNHMNSLKKEFSAFLQFTSNQIDTYQDI